jgi:catechol 2,3-dioxygenase-like lactoylglutathione lyase family enzyme
MKPLRTLGVRHLALYVKDPQASKKFYVETLGFQLEWEPDSENVYLSNQGLDNLAIHQRSPESQASPQGGVLDHFGIALPDFESVDEWHAWLASQKVEIAQSPKVHRDGAKSFYFRDPDGILIQMIAHPPIMARAGSQAQLVHVGVSPKTS